MSLRLHVLLVLVLSGMLAAPAGAAAEPEVEQLLERVRQAYSRVQGLELEAQVTADYAVAGMEERGALQFTAALAEDGRFRHEVPGQLVVAGNEEASFVNVPASRRYYRTQRTARSELDPAAREALLDHNLSLLLALSPDAAELLRSLGELSAGNEAGELRIQREDQSTWRLAFDPETHLLSEVEVDEAEMLRKAGATGVERAVRRIRYTRVDPAAAPGEDLLAFAPPAEAQQVERAGPAAGGGTLAGKAAPALSLPDLEGTHVTLAELGGRVVLVDFWASWCGPCVHGLPHIANLAREHADDGLVVLAVNLREDEATIRRFLEGQAFDASAMRLLRDSDGSAAREWGVMGIPYTVVIGRDGVVREVIVGLAPEKLNRAVAAALAE